MADTVKKSRIVSETDENLEECLLEEFNLRLKKCLSQDNLQADDNTHIYENVARTKTLTSLDYKDSTKLFLENEREMQNLNFISTSNGHTEYKITLDCENVDTSACLSTTNEAELISVKDRMFLSTDDTSCLLFTQTVTSPMLTPSEENIDFLKGFKRESISDNPDTLHSNGTASLPKENPDNETIDEQISNVENGTSSTPVVDELISPEQSLDQINADEDDTNVCVNIDSTITETHIVETTTSETNGLKKKKSKKSKSQHEKENISVSETNEDSCYNVNVKNLKSSFSKFDALQKKNLQNVQQADQIDADTSNCKKCGRPVFQMERVIAERCIWHRNCFRCAECSKQLLVDNFESHEGTLYCKSHFKMLFQPKAVEDDLPSSDKPDLGLEELHSLNVKERFQVFENVKDSSHDNLEKNLVKMERSPSILSKLARFQAKGMDVGVNDECLDGIPIEGSSSDENEEEEEDVDLIRAKRVQKEKPFHFLQMSDVKSKWEQGNSHKRDDLREERKQEIQNIRSRLFLGKQGKMKEAYQQAVVESESGGGGLKKEVPTEIGDTRSIKDKFERGEIVNSEIKREAEDMSIFESGIGKQSRSIFLELDAETTKLPKLSPSSPVKLSTSVRNARESKTPDREVYIDPDIVRSDELIEDSVVAKSSHTATKMLNKFREMEENLLKGQEPQGPKPLKRFTPPREPLRRESSSERESGTEDDSETEVDNVRVMEQDLIEAQKAARAQKLRAKFERWEQNEIKRENSVNVVSEMGDEQCQLETARSLCAKFESLRDSNNVQTHTNRVKVNRFVGPNVTCKGCCDKVYPLEMITVHGLTFHKNCFRCTECNMILRMNSYSYNRGSFYCITHFKRLFITKGNYDSGFGLEQHKDKWSVRTAA